MADDDSKDGKGINWVELSKVVAMPIVTLLVAGLFNSALNSRQTRDNNVRLYADMMGRREEADSALRKDMFKSILDTFLQRDPQQPRAQHLETELLNIELLAYNFHESLDLGPLFKHVQRELTADKEIDKALLWRLEKVAIAVKERQLAVLADGGKVTEGELNLDKVRADPPVQDASAWQGFGKAAVEMPPGKSRGGRVLCMSIRDGDGHVHFRQFKIAFADFMEDKRELQVKLTVSRPLPEKQCKMLLAPEVEQDNTEADSTFSVGVFAFPMIDNTRLSQSERCSVTVMSFDEDSVGVTLAYFQSSRASLKDKPYYDEMLHDLLHKTDSSEAKEPL